MSELTRAATEDGVVLAAAPTGGFVFPDVVPGYDAVTALCKLLELLAPEERALSALVAELPRPTLVHRAVPCPWGRKGLVMRLLNEQLASRRLDLMDGVKAYDERGWVQVLPDPDEPVVHRLRRRRDDRGALGGARRRGGDGGRGDRAGRRGRATNPGASLKLRLTPRRGGCFNRFSFRTKGVELTVDALPDFASLSDDDLARLIRGAEEEEEAISVRRATSTAASTCCAMRAVERLRARSRTARSTFPRRRSSADLRGHRRPTRGARRGRSRTSRRSPTTSCAR